MMDLFAPPDPNIPDIVWDERYMKWRATINVDGRTIVLGRFRYLVSAKQVRETAEYYYSQPVKNVGDLFG
jgi:hypothetical protein